MVTQRMSWRPLCAHGHKYAVNGAGKCVGGGRDHPAYQDISEATSVLLGCGRLAHQQIMWGNGAPDVQALGLAGHCILTRQPKTSDNIKTMPPPSANLTDNFVVLFTTCGQDVRNAKMLEVPREQ